MRGLTTPWLAVTAIGLSLTLQISDGFYHERALAWLVVFIGAAILGVTGCRWLVPTETSDGAGRRSADTGHRNSASGSAWRPHTTCIATRQASHTKRVLIVGVVMSAMALVTSPVARYMTDARPWSHPRLLIVVAGMVLAAIAGSTARSEWRRRAAVLVVLAGGLWMGAWTIRHSPKPHIDVMPVHVDAFAALARGQSPYAITFDDMYEKDDAFYAPEMRKDGRILFGFPYPPVSLLMAWPGHALLGDLRYGEVIAFVVAAGLMVWMRRDGVGLLCAAGLLLAPRLLFHIEQGWTEPFPIVLLAATSATALRRPALAWLPLGLLMASKQHMVLALLFAPWLAPAATSPRDTTVFIIKAGVVAAAVTLPIALMDVDAFRRSAVLLQLREPFRLDSLSFAALFVTWGWSIDKGGAALLSATAGVVATGLAWWRAARTPAGFAAALGLTCLLLAAFGKKAFLNYYMFVVAALLIAIAATEGTERTT